MFLRVPLQRIRLRVQARVRYLVTQAGQNGSQADVHRRNWQRIGQENLLPRVMAGVLVNGAFFSVAYVLFTRGQEQRSTEREEREQRHEEREEGREQREMEREQRELRSLGREQEREEREIERTECERETQQLERNRQIRERAGEKRELTQALRQQQQEQREVEKDARRLLLHFESMQDMQDMATHRAQDKDMHYLDTPNNDEPVRGSHHLSSTPITHHPSPISGGDQVVVDRVHEDVQNLLQTMQKRRLQVPSDGERTVKFTDAEYRSLIPTSEELVADQKFKQELRLQRDKSLYKPHREAVQKQLLQLKLEQLQHEQLQQDQQQQ